MTSAGHAPPACGLWVLVGLRPPGCRAQARAWSSPSRPRLHWQTAAERDSAVPEERRLLCRPPPRHGRHGRSCWRWAEGGGLAHPTRRLVARCSLYLIQCWAFKNLKKRGIPRVTNFLFSHQKDSVGKNRVYCSDENIGLALDSVLLLKSHVELLITFSILLRH